MGFPQLLNWYRICLQFRRHRKHSSIPGLGRSLRGGNGNPLQYSCLKNPMNRGSLAGYSPVDCKELDMTKQLSTAAHKS